MSNARTVIKRAIRAVRCSKLIGDCSLCQRSRDELQALLGGGLEKNGQDASWAAADMGYTLGAEQMRDRCAGVSPGVIGCSGCFAKPGEPCWAVKSGVFHRDRWIAAINHLSLRKEKDD